MEMSEREVWAMEMSERALAHARAFNECKAMFAEHGEPGIRLLTDEAIRAAWLSFGHPRTEMQRIVHDELVRRVAGEPKEVQKAIECWR